MREFTKGFDFSQGLRAFSNIPSNTSSLTRALNVVVRNSRLEAYEDVSYPVTDPGGLHWPISMDWPFPQLVKSYGGWYLGTRLGIYRLDSNFLPTIEVGVDLRDTIWTHADFGQYIVFSNGAMIYVMDVGNNDLHPHIDASIPACGCITNFRGQLVAGRVDGYQGNQLVYGQIGYASMELNKNAVAGNLVIPSSGNILALKSLGEFLVVYSTNGITIVHPYSDPVSTYGIVKHYPVGISGVGCVVGDDYRHIFIDEFGNLRALDAQGELTMLGYQEFITRLTNGTIMMSRDPGEGDVYISDGAISYLLTSEGMTEIHQCVTSLCSNYGSLIGPFQSIGDTGWIVVTDTQDLGMRSYKAIQGFDVSLSGLSASVGAYVKNLHTGSFGLLNMRTLNPKGQARLHLTGSQFRYALAGVNRTGLTLDSMRIMYKYTDKTFIRGAYATATAS